MVHVNFFAVGAAAIAVFVFAAVYYIVLAGPRGRLSPAAAATARPSPWLMALELLKSLGIAAILSGLVAAAGFAGLGAAVLLGVALWLAFPVALLAGSVMHENVPVPLAAIHAGDWFAKLLIISVIVTLWR